MEVTQIEREPHGHLPERRDIIGPVNSARRDAPGSGGKTEKDPTNPAGQLGRTSAGLKERRRAPSPKTPPIESAKESASA